MAGGHAVEGESGEDQLAGTGRPILTGHADAHGRARDRQGAGDIESGTAGIIQRTISG